MRLLVVLCLVKLSTNIVNGDDKNSDKSSTGLPKDNYPPLNDRFYLMEGNKQPRVLWWHDHIYPHSRNQKEIKCDQGSCGITTDRSTLQDPLTRGIIFYGTSWENDDMPLPRLPQHEWALFHEESPKNKWLLSTELGISMFNHTATFRRESDYPLSTMNLVNTDHWVTNKYFVSTKEKNRLQKEEGLAPLVYVQGDCNPPSGRDEYVKKLMKYIKVDSYGKCLNNKEMPQDIKGFHLLSSEKYYKFLGKYKFQISMENALCPDYMTEKIFRPLEIGSVPVYLGSEKIRDFMPSKESVIVVQDFTSPKELAEFINELNGDDAKYDKYLEHRETGITNENLHASIKRQPWEVPKWDEQNFGHHMFAQYTCHVCNQLHKRNKILKEHLKDNSVPPLPHKWGQPSHLGCPISKPFLKSDIDFNPVSISLLRSEAEALIKMFQANETDSSKWENYLGGTSRDEL